MPTDVNYDHRNSFAYYFLAYLLTFGVAILLAFVTRWFSQSFFDEWIKTTVYNKFAGVVDKVADVHAFRDYAIILLFMVA